MAPLVLVAADLAWAGVGYNPAIDRAVAEQPVTGAIRELQRAAPQRFVTLGDLAQNAIPMDYELPEARGYDLPVEERFDTALALQALARVPLPGRPAAGVHPADAAEGRPGPAALPVASSA